MCSWHFNTHFQFEFETTLLSGNVNDNNKTCILSQSIKDNVERKSQCAADAVQCFSHQSVAAFLQRKK